MSALSRLRPVVMVVAVGLAVTGCGFDTTIGDGTNRARAQEIVDDIHSAIDEAKAQNAEETGDFGEDPPAET